MSIQARYRVIKETSPERLADKATALAEDGYRIIRIEHISRVWYAFLEDYTNGVLPK